MFIQKLFVLLFICLPCYGYDDDNKQIFKCCPYGQSLEFNFLNSFDSAIKCQETIVGFPNYKIKSDNDTHLPSCVGSEKLMNFEVVDDTALLIPGTCVDYGVNNKVYAILCDHKSAKIHNFVNFSKLRKCCAFDEDYDLVERQCYKTTQTLDSDKRFEQIIGETVSMFSIGVPTCGHSDVLVEYHSQTHDLFVKESNLRLSVNSIGKSEFLPPNSFCFDSSRENETIWIAKACQPASVCDFIPCIRKCCGEGLKMAKINNVTQCIPHTIGIRPIFHNLNDVSDVNHPLNKTIPPEYGVLSTQSCLKYIVDDDYYLSGSDGTLFIAGYDVSFSHSNYCMETLVWGDEDVTRVFVCFPDDEPIVQHTLYAIGLTISAVFFALTLLVYICLPKLLNIHGKTLVCHVISMISACTCLAIVKFVSNVRPSYCLFIAYLIYFSFLAAFSWLNIMCFDIWLTFGSVRPSRGIKKSQWKRFLMYSLYAWGVPLLLTAITYCVEKFHLLPNIYRPHIGETKCFFQENNSPGHRIFFLVPISIQIFSNVILFILTALYCNRVKAEIHRMQSNVDGNEVSKKRFLADRAKFMMNLKLFIVMGVSWFLEILATVFSSIPAFWYISDTFNTLQGFMVFLIFVFKQKVLMSFKKKFGIPIKGTQSSSGTATTNASGSTTDRYSGKPGKFVKNASTSTISMTNLKR